MCPCFRLDRRTRRASPPGPHCGAKTMQPQGAARAIPLELSLRGAPPSIGLDLCLKGHKREHDGNAHDVDGAEGDEIWCHGEPLITRTHAKLRADTLCRATNAAATILVPEFVKNNACTCNPSKQAHQLCRRNGLWSRPTPCPQARRASSTKIMKGAWLPWIEARRAERGRAQPAEEPVTAASWQLRASQARAPDSCALCCPGARRPRFVQYRSS